MKPEFRFWDKKNKVMVYLDLANKNPNVSRHHVALLSDALREDWADVMLFIGTQDKKGRKIWEHDIASLDDPYFPIMEIGYSNAGFCFMRKRKPKGIIDFTANSDGYVCYVGRFEECEVIGNIYENPELRNLD